MGFFDIIELATDCPYCGDVRERDHQTKSFRPTGPAHTYEPGDNVHWPLDKAVCITSCKACSETFWVVMYVIDQIISGQYDSYDKAGIRHILGDKLEIRDVIKDGGKNKL